MSSLVDFAERWRLNPEHISALFGVSKSTTCLWMKGRPMGPTPRRMLAVLTLLEAVAPDVLHSLLYEAKMGAAEDRVHLYTLERERQARKALLKRIT